MSFLSVPQQLRRLGGIRATTKPLNHRTINRTKMSKPVLLEGEDRPGLVSSDWLRTVSKDPKVVVVLDTTWFMPSEKRDVLAEYQRSRIPGSRYFDIDTVCSKKSDLPHMLPSSEAFAKAVSELGISNDTRVIVADTNPHFLASARVWWMFRYFGHDNVSILENGIHGWVAKGLPIETQSNDTLPQPGKFVVQGKKSNLLKNLKQIVANIKDDQFLLLDARSSQRFRAQESEPRPGLVGGHVPGSVNLPFKRVLNGLGSLKTGYQLRDLASELELDLDAPMAASCGSGVSAAVLAFAFFTLGKSDVAIYDGSWAEYGKQTLNLPVATEVL